METGLDLLSLGMTIQDINDNGLGWQNGIGLVADVGSLIAPGVAGGGTAVRYADEAYAASKAGVNAAWDWGKRALGYGDEAADAGGDLARQADNLPGNPCAINSFSADTPVMTASGLKPIAELQVGDLVLAYNEATGQVEVQPITDTISHVDAEIVLLTIAGETLETTAEHPFYEMESAPWLAVGEQQGRWTDAIDLKAGDLVWQADGTTGVVQAVQVAADPQRMYNLSVAVAHTFFVGQQQWLVHNCGAALANTANGALRQLPENLRGATVAVGMGDDGKPVLAVYGKTQQITEQAIGYLRGKGWNVLDVPTGRGPEFHAERQLYEAGFTNIGISRQAGMCPDCEKFFQNLPNVTITPYKPSK